MQRYIAKRLLLAIPTLIGATIAIFVIMRVIPGDVATMILGGEEGGGAARAEHLEKIRRELGLDKPLHIQYWQWMSRVFRGELGASLWTDQDIGQMLAQRYPLTLQLGIMSLLVAWIIALPVGIYSALHQDTLIDYALRFFSIIGLAVPSFWTAIMLILFLVNVFDWLPPRVYVHPWDDPVKNFTQLIFPSLVLGTSLAALAARITRSSMLEVIRADYIRTARAKGLTERLVVMRHSLRNALLPIVTIVGVQLGLLISGSVVIEVVFTLPGLGRTLVDSIQRRDYEVTQVLVLVFTAGYVLVNLAVDVSYAWLDPRIRYA